MDRAESEGRVVVSADTDFGAILARSGKRAPSVILFRTVLQRRAWSQAALILANLPQVTEDLEAGALVTINTAGCAAGACFSSPGERSLTRGSPAPVRTVRDDAARPGEERQPPVMPVTSGHRKQPLTSVFAEWGRTGRSPDLPSPGRGRGFETPIAHGKSAGQRL